MAICAWPAALAQQAAVKPAFEVASIKTVTDDASLFVPLRITERGALQGRASLANIIRVAYDVPPYERVVGASQDVADKLEVKYDISALPPRAASPPARAEAAAMARQMLAERFGLRLRVDTEVVKATVLRVMKPGVLGRGLRPAPEGCRPLPTGAVLGDPTFEDAYKRSCVLTLFGNRIRGTATLDEFARVLSFGAQQPFLNRTDLEGQFAIDIEVDKASWLTVIRTRETDGPALLDALRNEMGLAASAEKQSVHLFVVDHVEPLIEN